MVTRNENHKKRLVIDYSPTINHLTMLDACPLPRWRYFQFYCIVQSFQYYWFMQCIPPHKINDSDKPFTAFQAENALYQFTQVPFGVTNGVAHFQRAMDSIITEEQLQATFLYLNNITVCGKDQREHDVNLMHFLEPASRRQSIMTVSVCFLLRNWWFLVASLRRGYQTRSWASASPTSTSCSQR